MDGSPYFGLDKEEKEGEWNEKKKGMKLTSKESEGPGLYTVLFLLYFLYPFNKEHTWQGSRNPGRLLISPNKRVSTKTSKPPLKVRHVEVDVKGTGSVTHGTDRDYEYTRTGDTIWGIGECDPKNLFCLDEEDVLEYKFTEVRL